MINFDSSLDFQLRIEKDSSIYTHWTLVEFTIPEKCSELYKEKIVDILQKYSAFLPPEEVISRRKIFDGYRTYLQDIVDFQDWVEDRAGSYLNVFQLEYYNQHPLNRKFFDWVPKAIRDLYYIGHRNRMIWANRPRFQIRALDGTKHYILCIVENCIDGNDHIKHGIFIGEKTDGKESIAV